MLKAYTTANCIVLVIDEVVTCGFHLTRTPSDIFSEYPFTYNLLNQLDYKICFIEKRSFDMIA